MAQWLDHAAPIYLNDNPSGKFVKVIRGQVQDILANVLFSGLADDCAAFSERLRIPFRLVPTSWAAAGEDVFADVIWQPIIG